jgi:hypothetical protein
MLSLELLKSRVDIIPYSPRKLISRIMGQVHYTNIAILRTRYTWPFYCGPVVLGLMGFKGDREDLSYHQAFRYANPPRKFANFMIQHILVSRMQSIKSVRQLRQEEYCAEGNSFSNPARG